MQKDEVDISSQEYKDGIIEKAIEVIKGVAIQTGLIST